MMLVVRVLLNTRPEKSALFPLVLSCLNPTYPLHDDPCAEEFSKLDKLLTSFNSGLSFIVVNLWPTTASIFKFVTLVIGQTDGAISPWYRLCERYLAI